MQISNEKNAICQVNFKYNVKICTLDFQGGLAYNLSILQVNQTRNNNLKKEGKKAMKKLFSIHEAAQHPEVSLTEYALRRMAKQGRLPCIYSGNRCLINIDQLIAQLNDLPGNINSKEG